MILELPSPNYQERGPKNFKCTPWTPELYLLPTSCQVQMSPQSLHPWQLESGSPRWSDFTDAPRGLHFPSTRPSLRAWTKQWNRQLSQDLASIQDNRCRQTTGSCIRSTVPPFLPHQSPFLSSLFYNIQKRGTLVLPGWEDSYIITCRQVLCISSVSYATFSSLKSAWPSQSSLLPALSVCLPACHFCVPFLRWFFTPLLSSLPQ